ncbi:hypothetical protein [Dipodfec virus UOA04_Rod_768]|nr:hypothetical protein [Dipodfec virus UOA04_Rod_768]
MNNDVKTLDPQENSDRTVLSVALLLNTKFALDALADMVDAFLIDSPSEGPDGETSTNLVSRATFSYFEKKSLPGLKNRRDDLAPLVLDLQYFLDTYTHILETFIRKKLSE